MAVRNERRTSRWQSTVQALQLGVGLQVVCLALPLLDLWFFGSIEGHVEAAYPEWDASEVALDRNAIVIALLVVGVLGLAGWLAALWAAKRGRAVCATVTTLFVLGMTTVAAVAGAGGDPYDQYVPLWLGSTILVLLALPGITAVLAVWFRGRD
ncbi:hypothetical protein [Jiangella rhizosphaerae]|uniref:Integral membrane protein n=1 Tax=Jiangella rhizosphaerae TaxID=2293569 RepID=A0A418KQL2_9ACTN|nr:hypothetical protein [Jiangella rhizosphaerae]RIQ22314.1 hypothetical protein DY240_13870 [Jiangella rhizosphaerae]